MTERYVHAAQVAFPGAAERAEDRVFGKVAPRYHDKVGATPSREDYL